MQFNSNDYRGIKKIVSDSGMNEVLLRMNVNAEGYFHAANIGSTFNFKLTQFMVAFDDENLYVIDLGTTGLNIQNIERIRFSDILSITCKSQSIGVAFVLTIKTQDGKKIELLANKKLMPINRQKDSIEILVAKFSR